MQSIWFRRVEHMGCIILAHSFQTCLPLETDPPAAPRCNFNHPGLSWGFKHLWVWLTGLLFISMNVRSQLLPTKAMGGVSRCKLFLMLLLCCDVCCLGCVVVSSLLWCVLSVLCCCAVMYVFFEVMCVVCTHIVVAFLGYVVVYSLCCVVCIVLCVVGVMLLCDVCVALWPSL